EFRRVLFRSGRRRLDVQSSETASRSETGPYHQVNVVRAGTYHQPVCNVFTGEMWSCSPFSRFHTLRPALSVRSTPAETCPPPNGLRTGGRRIPSFGASTRTADRKEGDQLHDDVRRPRNRPRTRRRPHLSPTVARLGA